MMKILIALILAGCTLEPRQTPPCTSNTGSECHLVEVIAWTQCEKIERCEGSRADALQCQIDAMYALCAKDYPCRSDVQATDAAWAAANQCSVDETETPC